MALTGSPSTVSADVSKFSSVGTVSSTAPDLSAKVAELEARLAQLEQVLVIGKAGDITIKGTSTMSIEAPVTVRVKAAMIMLN